MTEPSVLVLLALMLALTAVALGRGGVATALQAYGAGAQLLLDIGPQLLMGFALAGLVSVLLPTAALARLVGEGSGIPGLVIATVAGILTPGGPFLQFPLLATLARSGASSGAVAAYLTAWSLISVNRALVYELPLLGVPFTVARWAASLLVPLIVGLLTPPFIALIASRATGGVQQ
jgi:uncharacterized membrane protein YraQ (UPF0718 family)